MDKVASYERAGRLKKYREDLEDKNTLVDCLSLPWTQEPYTCSETFRYFFLVAFCVYQLYLIRKLAIHHYSLSVTCIPFIGGILIFHSLERRCRDK